MIRALRHYLLLYLFHSHTPTTHHHQVVTSCQPIWATKAGESRLDVEVAGNRSAASECPQYRTLSRVHDRSCTADHYIFASNSTLNILSLQHSSISGVTISSRCQFIGAGLRQSSYIHITQQQFYTGSWQSPSYNQRNCIGARDSISDFYSCIAPFNLQPTRSIRLLDIISLDLSLARSLASTVKSEAR